MTGKIFNFDFSFILKITCVKFTSLLWIKFHNKNFREVLMTKNKENGPNNVELLTL